MPVEPAFLLEAAVWLVAMVAVLVAVVSGVALIILKVRAATRGPISQSMPMWLTKLA